MTKALLHSQPFQPFVSKATISHELRKVSRELVPNPIIRKAPQCSFMTHYPVLFSRVASFVIKFCITEIATLGIAENHFLRMGNKGCNWVGLLLGASLTNDRTH